MNFHVTSRNHLTNASEYLDRLCDSSREGPSLGSTAWERIKLGMFLRLAFALVHALLAIAGAIKDANSHRNV